MFIQVRKFCSLSRKSSDEISCYCCSSSNNENFKSKWDIWKNEKLIEYEQISLVSVNRIHLSFHFSFALFVLFIECTFLSLFNQILITSLFFSSLDVICSYISSKFDNSTPDPHIISNMYTYMCVCVYIDQFVSSPFRLLSTHKQYTWPHTYWRIDCISRP